MKRFVPLLLVALFLAGWAFADTHLEVRALARRAAEGDPEAIFTLATLHDRGFDSIPVDSMRSTELYRESAAAGYLPAMNYLGYRLLSGEVSALGSDAAEGLRWLEKAATAGDVKAASNLGWLLTEGKYVERDYSKAAFWLGRAASEGLAVAQSMLGDLYRDGLGVDRDSLKADSLYSMAFENGLPDAAYKKADLNAGRYDSLSAEGLLKEGRYYYLRNAPSLGVKLFYKAADMGNAEAMALLGDAYTRAIGVPYDHNLSLLYYTRAALAGNPSAQFVIGELLDIFPDALDGLDIQGLTDEQKTPMYWYENAAEGNVTDAETATMLLLDMP